ncbi:MAG TPA: DUF2905 domain-containing protein [Bryobacteraceae bacterium]
MNLGRILILAGFALVGIGAVVLLLSRLNLPFGRMPGDLVWRGKNTTVYFPWVTCLLLSVLGTLLLWLLNRR